MDSEFIAKEVQRWLAQNNVKTTYTDPGSPWQNGFVESFRGRFHDECLNQEQLWTSTEARVVSRAHRRTLSARGITLFVAPPGAAHGSGLGRKRWVVERTFAWLHQFKRLRVRYERRADLHRAFLTLGCCVICARML